MIDPIIVSISIIIGVIATIGIACVDCVDYFAGIVLGAMVPFLVRALRITMNEGEQANDCQA